MRKYLFGSELGWLLAIALMFLGDEIYSQDRRFLLDLGNAAYPTNLPGWNNMTSGLTGAVLNDMVAVDGSSSSIDFEIVKNASNGYGNGDYFNSNGYNGVVGDYPASACRDSYFAYGEGGIFTLKGLNTSKYYTIKLFCSRLSSTNDRVGVYIINGTRYLQSAQNNSTQFVTFYHLKPTASGELTIDFNVAENSILAYLNVLDVTEITTPQIKAPQSLTLHSQTTGLKLIWSDQSNNETSFRIERKIPSQKSFTQVGEVPAGVIDFVDASALSGTKYQYRVYAVNSSMHSAFSNTLTLTTNGPPPDRRYLIDFGSPTNQTNLAGWNNMSNTSAGASLISMKDTNGDVSDVGFQMVTIASNNYGDGSVYNSNGYNGVVLDYPASACSDSYYSYGAGGTYKLTGLKANRFYNIRIFGSRTATTSDRVGKYVINGAQRVLNAANNNAQTIVFYNVIPDSNGEITLEFGVADNATLGYLNVMDILEHSTTGINKPTQLSVNIDSRNAKLQWADNASNEQGFVIERKSNLETTYKEIVSTAAGVTQYTDGLLNNGLDYSYRITAYNATERSPYSNTAVVSTPGQMDRRFLMDLGNPAYSTSTSGWNNMTGAETGAVLNSMVDSKNVSSGIGFEITKNASNGFGDGTPYNSLGYSGTVLDYPLNACRDSYFASGSGGVYTFKGLNPYFYYNITIFGSRTIADNLRVGKYIINGEKQNLNAANNSTNTITFRQVKPSGAGEIVLDFGVETGSSLGYINVIDFTEVSVPEGNPPLIQSAQVIAGGVKLDWKDNSNFETGCEIYRTTGSQTGVYSLLHTTAPNVTTYTDASAIASEIYFYRIRAVFSNGASPYSNSVISNNSANPPIFVTTAGTQQVNSGNTKEVTVQVSPGGNIPLDRKKIVILGSSTAEGFGATPYSNSWAGLYTQYLTQFDPTIELINLGKFGYTTADVLPAGNANYNITKALSYNPLMIIVNLPSNDIAAGISSATMMSNLATIKQLGEAAGVKVFITTTQPRNFTDVNQRTELQSLASSIMSTFGGDAIQLFTLLADANLNIQSSYRYDDVHVNNAGHNVIFDAIKAKTSVFLNKTKFDFSLTNAPYFVSLTRLSNETFKIVINPDVRADGRYENVALTVTDKNGNYANQSFSIEVEGSAKSILDELSFQYRYDVRKRMIKKKVPGADWVYMVYDNRDRLVMTQDGNQRSKEIPEWTFTKYDALNRPVLTGIYKDAESRSPEFIQESMQDDVNAFYIAAESNSDEWFEITGSIVHGYTNQSFPKVSSPNDYLTVTYYDNYSFQSLIAAPGITPALFDYDNEQLTQAGDDQGQEESESIRVTGQVTGSKIKNLETDEWIWSVNYYDDKYRSIQGIMQNHKGGVDKVTSVYDFVGKVLRTKTEHTITGASARSTTRKFIYDHAGRLMETWHQLNNDPSILLSRNEYNELGQLVEKKLHSTVSSATDAKQSVDYRYNIRGWLTRINDSSLTPDDAADSRDHFGMNLSYNETIASLGNTPSYNGNISAMTWSNSQGFSDVKENGYKYGYDPMNRITSADYRQKKTSNWGLPEYEDDEVQTANSFSETAYEYDLNGNIKHLSRTGEDGLIMDVLTYDYNDEAPSNKLFSVSDGGDITKGFVDGNVGSDDYAYDNNGSMILDKNKGITSIAYNYLNLPSKVTKNTGEYVKYIYDATGKKLSQQVYDASDELKKSTEYLGEYFYENDTLKFINHEEGRIVVTEAAEYQYNLKDHLGNVRVTFTSKEEIQSDLATFETIHETDEYLKFQNYDEAIKINNELFDHTHQVEGNEAQTTFYSTRLTGGATNARYGLAKSLSVMPGDKLNMEVHAKYLDTNDNNWNAALINFMASIAPLGGAPTGTIIDGGSVGSLGQNPFPFPDDLLNRDNDVGLGPKAYLNYLVFDRSYKFIEGGFKRLSDEKKENGDNVGHERLYFEDILIKEPGYVYIYLSNENETEVEVYFDDFKVDHIKSPVIQTDDYYPFGLTYNSYSRENSVENKYLYNQGTGDKTFKTERVYDLELNVDQSKYRTYDYITGRWWQVDPKADVEGQESWSTYQFGFNNPIRNSDPEGDIVFAIPLVYYAVVAVAAVVITYQAKRTIDATAGYIQQSNKSSTSTTELNSESKARGSDNEKTNKAAKTGQEAHRQEQEKLKAEGAETEVPLTLKDGTKVRKDAVLPDGTAVIIKPDTPSGRKSAEKREKLMKDNDYKTKKIFYDPKDPKFQPGSRTYIGPKK